LLTEFGVGKKKIGGNNPVFIIAEIGVNHNGNLEYAKKLIDVAKEGGADAVKFQSFVTQNLVTQDADAAAYQKQNDPTLKQKEILEKLELGIDEIRTLKSYAENKKLIFLSTPFDLESLEMLKELDLEAYKISSGDLTNHILLSESAKLGKPILLSSGMANIEEIKEAIQCIKDNGCCSFGIMQCTSCYPTKQNDCNLNAITTLKNSFNVPIGFSDHTVDSVAAVVSVGLGAKFIEKHITLDHSMNGPDHKMSMEPNDFKAYVKSIRNAEKTLGDGVKQTLPCEQEIKKLGRKSIVSKRFLPKGHVITSEDLDIKRPGMGIPPKFYNQVIGKKTKSDLNEDNIIDWDLIE